MLDKTDIAELEIFHKFYSDDLLTLQEKLKRATSPDKFSLSMAIYNLEKFLAVIKSIVENHDSDKSVPDRLTELSKVYAYFDEHELEHSAEYEEEEDLYVKESDLNTRLIKGAAIWDYENEKWIVETIWRDKVDLISEEKVKRFNMSMSSLKNYRYSPFKVSPLEKEIMNILVDVPSEAMKEVGFIGWLCGEIVKNTGNTNNPRKVIKEVYKMLADEDLDEKLSKFREDNYAGNA